MQVAAALRTVAAARRLRPLLRGLPTSPQRVLSPQTISQRAIFGWNGRGGKFGKDDPNAADEGAEQGSDKTDSSSKAEPEKPGAVASSKEGVAAEEKVDVPMSADSSAKDSLVPVAAGDNLSRDNEVFIEPDLLAFGLRERPLLPGHRQLLLVFDKKVMDEVTKLVDKKTNLHMAVFLQKEEHPKAVDIDLDVQAYSPTPADLGDQDPIEALHLVGTRAKILSVVPAVVQSPDEDGRAHDALQVVIQGRELITLDKVLSRGPPLRVQASLQSKSAEGESVNDESIKAYMQEILQTIRELTKINPQFREHANFINHTGSFQYLHKKNNGARDMAHMAVSLTSASGSELQQVLSETGGEEKLRLVLHLLKKDLEMSKLQAKIASQIEEKASTSHREHLLREQLKAIKKELGEDKSDGTDKLLQKFKHRLEGKTIPKDAKQAIDSELEKFSNLAKESQEYQITRNYLDWLTLLPWSVHSKDTLSLLKAKDILDRDHYGLDDVKQRILELIAVGSLRGTVQGKIVCLVGPPGVGKTSIGKSIAQALGREFYRFSVGGLYDVAEIKGHRRTYVGAMPGKIVQCLKKVEKANPLVLIDEVDKIGRGHQGDPASALLELLDPSQNSNFLDHYLDVPIDCSKILFVCTANVTDTIPGPLLDRMEVIRLYGYDMQEKLKIAEDYLVPNAMREVGLWPQLPAPEATPSEPSDADAPELDSAIVSSSEVTVQQQAAQEVEAMPTPPATKATISEGALQALIRWYCRESGVRNLQKHIEKICRKLSRQVVERREAATKAVEETPAGSADEPSAPPETPPLQAEPSTSSSSDAAAPSASIEDQPAAEEEEDTAYLHVTEDRLAELVGKQKFLSDRLYEGSLPPGTVTGLAWTSMGGSVLYIEAVALPRAGEAKKGAPAVNVTGQLGSVMKESSQLALLVTRRLIAQFPEQSKFFEEHEVHVHCPEGATPKDGPSAGVTMVTSLFSLATDTAVRQDLAMTGEVSLNGKVLPVGGIKEKLIAARRASCTVLIIPETNRRDFDELPEYLREGLEVHFATEINDVLKVAFPTVACR